MMKMGLFAVLVFFVVLVSINCATSDDVLGESKPNPGLDVKNHGAAEAGNVEKEKPGETDKMLSPVAKETEQVIRGKIGAQNGSDASKQGLKKGTGDAEQGSGGGKVQGKDTEQKEKKKKTVEDPKEGSKIDGRISKGSETELKNEKPHGEECDMFNRCTDEEKSLVACLRVSGNDAPGLSLLIQNKGKGIMVVKITVPNFVQVERDSVELKEKENRKVKVSFKKGKEDGDILLSTGTSRCSLNLKSLLASSSSNGGKGGSTLPKSSYVIFLTETKSLSFMFLALIVIVASVGVWMSLRQRRRLASSSNYQKLDMELPVSIGVDKTVKNSAEVNDGWDNGWDDDWDDEEAPMSPLPVTPSLSSKSLPSRKLNKD